ncbi:hypothetical protein BSU04_33065 [Caballeronia sordidicola]|jgi:hypothetical protein|uniref:Uncharacterized protein n=1 Tax=Caballeronia sordidicola TaxID=196367 RepID=A0A226WSK1_CABSO|nr:hypothetical protein BSU04_33065 [Caballeronia sordidicola]
MLLIGGAVGFMSGVLLMFFLLGLRVPEDRVVDVTSTPTTHNPAKARTRSAEAFFRVRGSRA